ncbi:hypothetical protein J1614_005185 [Plenodomus biglobosus]|nr:hypothetical protein J1614_005185 [Plenodomus biglobosus]
MSESDETPETLECERIPHEPWCTLAFPPRNFRAVSCRLSLKIHVQFHEPHLNTSIPHITYGEAFYLLED